MCEVKFLHLHCIINVVFRKKILYNKTLINLEHSLALQEYQTSGVTC